MIGFATHPEPDGVLVPFRRALEFDLRHFEQRRPSRGPRVRARGGGRGLRGERRWWRRGPGCPWAPLRAVATPGRRVWMGLAGGEEIRGARAAAPWRPGCGWTTCALWWMRRREAGAAAAAARGERGRRARVRTRSSACTGGSEAGRAPRLQGAAPRSVWKATQPGERERRLRSEQPRSLAAARSLARRHALREAARRRRRSLWESRRAEKSPFGARRRRDELSDARSLQRNRRPRSTPRSMRGSSPC